MVPGLHSPNSGYGEVAGSCEHGSSVTISMPCVLQCQAVTYRRAVLCRLIPRSILRTEMKTNMNASFPLAVSFDVSPIDTNSGIVYAAIVLLGLYVLIVLEVSCIADF